MYHAAWAIGAGTAIAVFGTVVLTGMYVIFLFTMFTANASPESIDLEASDLASMVLLGAVSTMAGGFVAARLAKRQHLRYGAAVGAVSLGIWLLFNVIDPGEGSGTWSDVATDVLAIPAGALGGYFAARANKPLKPTSGAAH
jgi:putative membrane protein (TIGR04086 family)